MADFQRGRYAAPPTVCLQNSRAFCLLSQYFLQNSRETEALSSSLHRNLLHKIQRHLPGDALISKMCHPQQFTKVTFSSTVSLLVSSAKGRTQWQRTRKSLNGLEPGLCSVSATFHHKQVIHLLNHIYFPSASIVQEGPSITGKDRGFGGVVSLP